MFVMKLPLTGKPETTKAVDKQDFLDAVDSNGGLRRK
jgi:hypothetical protein